MMRLLQGRGNAKRIVCPYHAWTYSTDGCLQRARHMEHTAGFDPAKYRLPEVRCEVWEGWVYVTLNPEAPSICERLSSLTEIVARYHMGEYVEILQEDHEWNTNWKLLTENFMEGYHLSPLHRTTLHPVNPTKLCRHFSPGEAHFGYYAGFSPDLPRTTKGHPDLSEEEADRCVMFAVPPGLAVGGAADYSSFISIQPETPDKVRVKQGLFFHGDHWTQDTIDYAVELFERTMAEDKDMLVDLKRGLYASRYASGPLAPADYEGPIWDFIQYLGRRLGPVLPAPDARSN